MKPEDREREKPEDREKERDKIGKRERRERRERYGKERGPTTRQTDENRDRDRELYSTHNVLNQTTRSTQQTL